MTFTKNELSKFLVHVLSLTVFLDAVFHELSSGIELLGVLSSLKIGKEA